MHRIHRCDSGQLPIDQTFAHLSCAGSAFSTDPLVHYNVYTQGIAVAIIPVRLWCDCIINIAHSSVNCILVPLEHHLTPAASPHPKIKDANHTISRCHCTLTWPIAVSPECCTVCSTSSNRQPLAMATVITERVGDVLAEEPGERFDLFDEHHQPLGCTALRSDVHKQGLWHRAVYCWVFDAAGRVLLQQRSAGKSTGPGQWDLSCAEHLQPGEVRCALSRSLYGSA